MTPGLPVVLELVRRVADLVDPADLQAALPFAEQLAGEDVDAFGPLEDCIAAFMKTTTAEQWRTVFAAVTKEEIVIKSDGEEIRISHGDLVNVYAVPGLALGVALAMHVALAGTEPRTLEPRTTLLLAELASFQDFLERYAHRELGGAR